MSAATAGKIGKALILIGALNLILLFSWQVFGAEVQIIEIRKSLPLKSSDPVVTDYYLNAGENLSIKPGTMFTLYRRVSIIDRLGTNHGRPLAIPVGKIKILYVSRDLSVARLHSIQGTSTSPVLEYQGIMLGDVINVGSAEKADDQGEKTSDQDGKKDSDRDIATAPTEIIELKARSSYKSEQDLPSSLYPQGSENTELVR